MSMKVQTQRNDTARASFMPVQSKLLQRKCACGGRPGVDGECAECRAKRLARQSSATGQAGPAAVPPVVHDVLRSPGRVLDAGTRAFMEPRFGHDFSKVRVHTTVPEGIQAKLTVNQPGDKYEQEADQVAEQVMRMPEPEIPQSKPLSQKPSETVQRKETLSQASNITSELQTRINSIRGGGQALPGSTRAFMEPRFGQDFSQVRIHTDVLTAETARAINAKAYTMGQDIVFGTGQYAPGTSEGRKLVAHELTHVVQQGSKKQDGTSSGEVSSHKSVSKLEKTLQGPILNQLQRVSTDSKAEEGSIHGGQITRLGKAGDADDNEFIFWNYLNGDEKLRKEHTDVLNDKIVDWQKQNIFAKRPDLRIKIIGNASRKGSTAVNTELAKRRALVVQQFLKGHGIPESRIDFTGVGSTQPLADEKSPEDEARNRRVELILYVPTHRVTDLGPNVHPEVIDFSTDFKEDVEFESKKDSFTERVLPAIVAKAHVKQSGSQRSEIGFLQFLTKDTRLGIYKSDVDGRTVVHDYGRCTSLFLPCRDVEKATNPFSFIGSSRSSAEAKPTEITFSDAPGAGFPLKANSAVGKISLAETIWSMKFTLVLGARVGEQFMPIQHVDWRLTSASFHSPIEGTTRPRAKVGKVSEGKGFPSGLPIESAMELRTCRLLTRSMDDVCQPHEQVLANRK